jgi:hypothetical protein
MLLTPEAPSRLRSPSRQLGWQPQSVRNAPDRLGRPGPTCLRSRSVDAVSEQRSVQSRAVNFRPRRYRILVDRPGYSRRHE